MVGTSRYVGIFIRKSRADQSDFGAFRSLNAAGKELSPYTHVERWFDMCTNWEPTNKVFGEDVLPLVTRSIKMIVAQRHLPSGRFPTHSLRVVGATCLYRADVDLEYIRMFGRWKSQAVAIYLHFGDKILRNLSPCMMDSAGLTSKLRVCTASGQKVVFDQGGDMARVLTYALWGRILCWSADQASDGYPSGGERKKRAEDLGGGNSNTGHTVAGERMELTEDDKVHVADAKQLWGYPIAQNSQITTLD